MLLTLDKGTTTTVVEATAITVWTVDGTLEIGIKTGLDGTTGGRVTVNTTFDVIAGETGA
jgi:hypothetical protein